VPSGSSLKNEEANQMEIIGEKINTTIKSVRKAVEERDGAFIQALARMQATAGAHYLDVNSGMALHPEEEAEDFEWLVPIVQEVVDLPVCIDSSRRQPLEAALKLHKGRAMINSVNGDQPLMETIFPLAKEFRCKIIALTSNKEKGIPSTCKERLKIAEKIAKEAQIFGIPLEDIYFDPLVLPVSTADNNAVLFLETLKEIKQTLKGAKTISGLSNISFGLPKRRLINRIFLALALAAGMDAAILDPTDAKIMAMAQATETLVGKDAFCGRYLKAYKEGKIVD
jgi:5-methyltetrahydrofolate--homocysteine methyltransferase